MKPILDTVKNVLPWHIKIAVKILLSRLPISYRSWNTLGIFSHGAMADARYVLSVFGRHYRVFAESKQLDPTYACLELGPGDTVASALIAAAFSTNFNIAC